MTTAGEFISELLEIGYVLFVDGLADGVRKEFDLLFIPGSEVMLEAYFQGGAIVVCATGLDDVWAFLLESFYRFVAGSDDGDVAWLMWEWAFPHGDDELVGIGGNLRVVAIVEFSPSCGASFFGFQPIVLGACEECLGMLGRSEQVNAETITSRCGKGTAMCVVACFRNWQSIGIAASPIDMVSGGPVMSDIEFIKVLIQGSC